MEKFFEGFEKAAVSMDWVTKRTLGGLKSRASKGGKPVADKLLKQHEKFVSNASPQQKAILKGHKWSREQGPEFLETIKDVNRETKTNPRLATRYVKAEDAMSKELMSGRRTPPKRTALTSKSGKIVY